MRRLFGGGADLGKYGTLNAWNRYEQNTHFATRQKLLTIISQLVGYWKLPQWQTPSGPLLLTGYNVTLPRPAISIKAIKPRSFMPWFSARRVKYLRFSRKPFNVCQVVKHTAKNFIIFRAHKSCSLPSHIQISLSELPVRQGRYSELFSTRKVSAVCLREVSV